MTPLVVFCNSRVLAGDVRELLPMLHYSLLSYSRHIAKLLLENGYELYAKSDLRFMEEVLKLSRSVFNTRPELSAAQFLASGYAERKLQFTCKLIKLVLAKDQELQGRKPGSSIGYLIACERVMI